MGIDICRLKQILIKDRLMDISSLSDLISNETADRLSKFIDITSCITKINVANNGELNLLISIKSTGIKTR